MCIERVQFAENLLNEWRAKPAREQNKKRDDYFFPAKFKMHFLISASIDKRP